MALVIIATMFLARERMAHRETAELLSWRDVVAMMRHRLPIKIVADEGLAESIIDNRHLRRRQAMESTDRTQAAILTAFERKAV